MRRLWITSGIIVATGLATWQLVSFAQPPGDRPPMRDMEDHRKPRDDKRRAYPESRNDAEDPMQRPGEFPQRVRQMYEFKMRDMENNLRAMRESGARDFEIRAAEDAFRVAQEGLERVNREISALANGGTPDVTREVHIFEGRGEDRIPMTDQEMKRLEQFRRNVDNYRREKDPEKKTQLKEQIREQLAEQLDYDIEKREQQIDEMENRMERLRQQVKAARESKATTIDSLVDMLDERNAQVGISPAWVETLQRGDGSRRPDPGFRFDFPKFEVEIRGEGDFERGPDDRRDRPQPPPPRAPEPPRPPRESSRGDFEHGEVDPEEQNSPDVTFAEEEEQPEVSELREESSFSDERPSEEGDDEDLSSDLNVPEPAENDDH